MVVIKAIAKKNGNEKHVEIWIEDEFKVRVEEMGLDDPTLSVKYYDILDIPREYKRLVFKGMSMMR